MKSVIYKTTGRADEYCKLALNHYKGCTHGCLYCWAPKVTHQKPSVFHAAANPRITTTETEISASLYEQSGPVLLSFLSDPYQPAEKDLLLTRKIIQIFREYDINFTILTKAGALAQRDFKLYRPGDSFGVTLTFLDEAMSRDWEPRAGLPHERIQNLIIAKKEGIKTWVSLEPVISPAETIALIHTAAPWVDHFKVGKLNYDRLALEIDWKTFAEKAIEALRFNKKDFYIKKDLGKYIGYPEGLKERNQLP